MPSRITLCTNTTCGYKCIFCNNKNMKPILLSFEKIESFIRSFKSEETEYIDISGYGDVFLHPNFNQIIQLLIDRKLKYSIITTGENLDVEKQKLMRDSPLKWINFSLNSLDKETKIMLSGGQGNFEQTIRNYESFVKKPRSYHVIISVIVNRYNFLEMPKFIEYAHNTGAEVVRLQEPILELSHIYPEGFGLKYDSKEKETLNLTYELAKKYNIDIYGSLRPTEGTSEKIVKQPITSCISPWTEVSIAPEGEVAICCFLSRFVVGNINTNSFVDIWNNSPQLNRLRNCIKNNDDSICKKTCMNYERK